MDRRPDNALSTALVDTACNNFHAHCFIQGVNGKLNPRDKLTLVCLFGCFRVYYVYEKRDNTIPNQ